MRVLLMVVAVAAQAGERTEVVQGTSGSRSEALEVRAGGLVVRSGEAGSAFGSVQAGTAKRQLSYFVIFKHRLGGEGRMEWSEETTMDGNTGHSKQVVTIDGSTLRIEYRVEVDEKTKKVAKESLTINKKAVDVSRGRVFLVDLTVSPPRWEQRKASLPAGVGEASGKKAAEELVQKVLAGLSKQDRKVKEFLEAAKK